MRYENAARKIIDVLLENEPPVATPQPAGQRQPSPNGRLVRLKTPQGEVQADWNGYYDMRMVNRGTPHSIGYPGSNGRWTHGPIHQGDEVLDQVPSFDEWNAEQQRAKAQPQQPPL